MFYSINLRLSLNREEMREITDICVKPFIYKNLNYAVFSLRKMLLT